MHLYNNRLAVGVKTTHESSCVPQHLSAQQQIAPPPNTTTVMQITVAGASTTAPGYST